MDNPKQYIKQNQKFKVEKELFNSYEKGLEVKIGDMYEYRGSNIVVLQPARRSGFEVDVAETDVINALQNGSLRPIGENEEDKIRV